MKWNTFVRVWQRDLRSRTLLLRSEAEIEGKILSGIRSTLSLVLLQSGPLGKMEHDACTDLDHSLLRPQRLQALKLMQLAGSTDGG